MADELLGPTRKKRAKTTHYLWSPAAEGYFIACDAQALSSEVRATDIFGKFPSRLHPALILSETKGVIEVTGHPVLVNNPFQFVLEDGVMVLKTVPLSLVRVLMSMSKSHSIAKFAAHVGLGRSRQPLDQPKDFLQPRVGIRPGMCQSRFHHTHLLPTHGNFCPVLEARGVYFCRKCATVYWRCQEQEIHLDYLPDRLPVKVATLLRYFKHLSLETLRRVPLFLPQAFLVAGYRLTVPTNGQAMLHGLFRLNRDLTFANPPGVVSLEKLTDSQRADLIETLGTEWITTSLDRWDVLISETAKQLAAAGFLRRVQQQRIVFTAHELESYADETHFAREVLPVDQQVRYTEFRLVPELASIKPCSDDSACIFYIVARRLSLETSVSMTSWLLRLLEENVIGRHGILLQVSDPDVFLARLVLFTPSSAFEHAVKTEFDSFYTL